MSETIPSNELVNNITENDDGNWMKQGPEMLVNMAEKGEINPWDVDLILVIDKFLTELSQKQDKQELKEAARIIFFVSVLLRIKSQYLDVKAHQKEEELFDDLIDFDAVDFEEFPQEDDVDKLLTPKALDGVLKRNTRTFKEPRKRSVTLEDLLSIFKEVESKTKSVRKSKKTSLQDFEDDGDIVIREDEETDITELAHDENLEEKIEILAGIILQRLDPGKFTTLRQLQSAVGDWVDIFLSALFLSHSGKTEIIQEKFYENIMIKRVV
jgi:segregation and condensation protein A